MAERPSPKREATGSIPVRRAYLLPTNLTNLHECNFAFSFVRLVRFVGNSLDDDVAERRGAKLQPSLTQVRFLPSSLWP